MRTVRLGFLGKILALTVALCLALSACGGAGGGKTVAVQGKNLQIVPPAAATLSTEAYDNGLVSLTIPAGWVVTTMGDCSHYTLRVADPAQPARQFFYNLKSEGYPKSVQAQQYFNTYYPGTFGIAPVINEYTADCFFAMAFTEMGTLNNTSAFLFPATKDFAVVENFGPTVFGGDLLRGTFTNEAGTACDGLFTATVYDAGSYMVNSNMFDFTSPMVDAFPLSVYNTMFISAPAGEFPEYETLLTGCLSSVEFSDKFYQTFNAEQDAVLAQVRRNSRVNSEISDMIADSWSRRSSSYDIMSQKQSDATLGYERVYDKETGDTYRAYNGFLDDYDGDRFEAVTDDMYHQAVAGYIEEYD